MERSEAELIAAVLRGDSASFEPLVAKYSRESLRPPGAMPARKRDRGHRTGGLAESL